MSDQPSGRQVIRSWIAEQRATLEAAQASGTLARTKLDLRDLAVARLPTQAGRPDFNSTFNEELDAFCADLRLANVTVQQQIERRPFHTARAIAVAVGVGFIVLVITALNVQDPALGFGLPILAAGIAFFLAR